jgi:ABC-type multidrug transport system fused ATPase/permease subunit
VTTAAAPVDDDPVAPRTYDAAMLRRLLRYLRPHGRSVAVAFLLIVATSGLDLVPPYLTKVAIDRHIARGDAAGLRTVALVVALWAKSPVIPVLAAIASAAVLDLVF